MRGWRGRSVLVDPGGFNVVRIGVCIIVASMLYVLVNPRGSDRVSIAMP